MEKVTVILFLLFLVKTVSLFGVGSGTNGRLRLCVVEGRGSYKRISRYCPVLDTEDSGAECVVGTDRLDCLRRISKGRVDFGVFSPEDLVAAQWANVDLLVTNELRTKNRPFARSVVSVVNRNILADGPTTLHAILKNRTLCHPGTDVDDIRPFSETLTGYLESLVLPRKCDPDLSLAENRIKALADYFGSSCKAGAWVVDKARDAQLKHTYWSLCSACGAPYCSVQDRYWGDLGALNCLVEVGEVAWGELDDVLAYFGLKSTPGKSQYPSPHNFALLCRDGSWQAIEKSNESCVWLHKPWPVILARRKAAEAVAKLAESLSNSSVTVDTHWRGALAALLEVRQAQGAALQPPVPAQDYLSRAKGFREAYSQRGCNPPRHITFCTTSLVANNKCEWLSEAGAVYGVAPALQCAARADTRACARAVRDGDAHVMQAGGDWLITGMRDYNLTAILHEATPIVEKTHTVVAYVHPDSSIEKLSDLRGKRASFPSYDGVAWHSVLRYIVKNQNIECKDIHSYFSDICAPGFEKWNVTDAVKNILTKNCYVENGEVLEGEEQALRSLVEGKSDVAFISIDTYNKYAAKLLPYPWAQEPLSLKPVCPEDNSKYCFISWSNIGHIFVPDNLPPMRSQEIINVLTKLDQLFGKHHPFHTPMFSMYGPYNHEIDVLFHNSTKNLISTGMLYNNPYDRIPLSFERSLSNWTDSCQADDFTNFGAKAQPTFLVLLISLVFCFVR